MYLAMTFIRYQTRFPSIYLFLYLYSYAWCRYTIKMSIEYTCIESLGVVCEGIFGTWEVFTISIAYTQRHHWQWLVLCVQVYTVYRDMRSCEPLCRNFIGKWWKQFMELALADEQKKQGGNRVYGIKT